MNTINNARPNKGRVIRTYHVAPTTRAIRAALAVSVTMLALSGSGVALAGTCTTDATTNTVSCDGAFTNLPGGSFTPVADLTLVLGDSAPTSVTPAAGTVGVDASWGGNVGVVSHADITTSGADGIQQYGSTSATLTNYGGITTDVTATGAEAASVSAYGDVTVVNDGPILAYSTGSYAVTALGAYSSHGNVSIDNQAAGTITATANSGTAIAVDAYAKIGSVTVGNEGAITATSTSGAATGIYAHATAGDASVTNSGTISATAGNYVNATGIHVVAGDTATATNSGSISVAAGNYGTATGIHAVGVNGATVTNSGSITGSGSTVYGINDYASTGLASVTNTSTGNITLTGSNITGIRASGYHGTHYVNNAGTISLTAYHGKYTSTQAYGIKASSVNNSGSITVASNGPLGTANGINASAYGSNQRFGDQLRQRYRLRPRSARLRGGHHPGASSRDNAYVVNSGDVTVTANPSKYTYQSNVRGIDVDASGNVGVVNSGSVSATTTNGGATGMLVFGEGYVQISNSGSVVTTGTTSAVGIDAGAGVNGSFMIDNSGSIAVTANAAFGLTSGFGTGDNGNSVITNSGDITVNAGFQGHGVNEYDGSGTGSMTFNNSGTIAVSTNVAANVGYVYNTIGGAAYGVNTVNTLGNTSITNSGSITSKLYSYSTFANGLARYQAGATGLFAYSHSGDIAIGNSGSVSASSEVRSIYFGTQATGIKVTNDFGDVALTNSGTVSATALTDYRSDSGQSLATGILVNDFRGNDTIANGSTGSISANSSTLLYNSAAATGIFAYSLVGTIAATNAGAISATATSGATSYVGFSGVTTATGVLVNNPLGATTSVTNYSTGAITATASSPHYGAASATGINATVDYGNVSVTNAGSITATAQAAGHSDVGDAATAVGELVTNGSTVAGATTTVGTSANSAITANASAYLSAIAQGVAVSGANVAMTSAGAINATAAADAVHGTAIATGVLAYGSNLAVTLGADSDINAVASGNAGTAAGLSLSGDTVTASNAGTINAQFNGAHGNTYGAIIASSGDLVFTNSGHITATDADYAVGVTLASPTSTTLVNSGSITASSTAAGSIAVLTGASADTIQNTGTITGALITGAGNDTLTNSAGGVWNATGTSTDFGSGDDTIANAGTINLSNSAIELGSFATAGNTFTNSGLITAFGSNSIDMGANNANPFTNTGIVDLRSGVPGNSLTLTGNWAGSGQLGVNVDPLRGSSDMLHIVGNVAASSVTSVNVDLIDLPTTAISSVPVVTVTGDSVAGNFVLGDVHFDTAKSFLVVQGVSMLSNIDTSNAKPDVFSIGVGVTGVTDSGALAASIVPGIESLMNSEVGTWRQRMGVLTPTAQGSVGLWARAFDDSGTVNPGHIAGNFGQEGNFSFDQTNSGQEIGVDFAISQNLSAGLILGNAQATQHLDGTGDGRNRISGDTRGAYATWMGSGGFYLDASYRSMSFDARLDTGEGESRTTGSADAFNVELGQSWALGEGFKLVPQIQYTKTTIGQGQHVVRSIEWLHLTRRRLLTRSSRTAAEQGHRVIGQHPVDAVCLGQCGARVRRPEQLRHRRHLHRHHRHQGHQCPGRRRTERQDRQAGSVRRGELAGRWRAEELCRRAGRAALQLVSCGAWQEPRRPPRPSEVCGVRAPTAPMRRVSSK